MAKDGLALIGVAVLLAGFLLRWNPLLAVVVAAGSAGLAGGLSPIGVLRAFGHAFNQNRYVSLVWLILPVVGLLERHGLQERARARIAAMKGATAGRLLLAYLALRQVTAALGLAALGGHAQMVRPLVAPMAEAAAEAQAQVRAGDTQAGGVSARLGQIVRAYAASADNIGAFFGEDIFVAMGSILLIRGVLQSSGIVVEPLRLSLWAIPTALAALAIHGGRLLRLDSRIASGGLGASAPLAE